VQITIVNNLLLQTCPTIVRTKSSISTEKYFQESSSTVQHEISRFHSFSTPRLLHHCSCPPRTITRLDIRDTVVVVQLYADAICGGPIGTNITASGTVDCAPCGQPGPNTLSIKFLSLTCDLILVTGINSCGGSFIESEHLSLYAPDSYIPGICVEVPNFDYPALAIRHVGPYSVACQD